MLDIVRLTGDVDSFSVATARFTQAEWLIDYLIYKYIEILIDCMVQIIVLSVS